MKKLACLLVACGAASAMAQQETTPPAAPPTPVVETQSPNTLTSLAGEFFGTNFVNLFGFANGLYDSNQQALGKSGSNGSAGIDVGGGIQISHDWRTSVLSLNYRGDYRNYNSNNIGSGTNQYLALNYSRRLSRRWTLSVLETGGIMFYGNTYYNTLAGQGLGVQTNPFSPSSRFTDSSLYLTYQASPRLSYTVGTSFFLNRYTYSGSIGSTGGLETGSVEYKFTQRTSAGLTYSHDDFYYEHSIGESHINGFFVSGTHRFGRDWNVHGSFGMTLTENSGTFQVPIQFIFNDQTVTGYAVGHYDTSRTIPTLEGGISKGFRQYTFSASAGRGVSPGNGTLLTSSHTYFGGVASRSFRQSNISGAAYYSHISSIANQVESDYAQTSLNASYSRVIFRHVSASASYGHFRYGAFLKYGAVSDNRITFGISVSTRSIPITLF